MTGLPFPVSASSLSLARTASISWLIAGGTRRLCTSLVLVDADGDVHPGRQRHTTGVGERNPHRDHLRNLLEVPGTVGLREQREFGGRRILDLGHDARHRNSRVGVD